MDLSIIIVNYNDRPHLDACLSSLQKHAPSAEHEVIVVDNASSDGSRDWIAGAFPAVRLIENPANEGFSKANNLGARESRGEFLLFLNTDTVVPSGALDGLLAKLKSDPSLGAAGPALVHGGRGPGLCPGVHFRRTRPWIQATGEWRVEGSSLDGPRSYQVSFGRKVNFAAQLWQKLVLNRYFEVRQKSGGKDRSVGWLSAACLLCRRTAFEQAGGFDERFFIYFEDIDLCFRMRKAGWELAHVPGVRVFHKGGATTAPRAAASRFEYRKSQLYFYEKHNSRLSSRLLRLYLTLNFRLLTAHGAFRGEDGVRLKQRYAELLRRGGGSR